MHVTRISKTNTIMAVARDPHTGHTHCLRLRPGDLNRDAVSDGLVFWIFDMITRDAITVSTARSFFDYLERLEEKS